MSVTPYPTLRLKLTVPHDPQRNSVTSRRS